LNIPLNTPAESVPDGAAGEAFHIAFGVDAPYFRYMGVTITSVVENNPGIPFVFHVFAFSVSDDHRSRLRQLEARYGVTIQLHIIDSAIFREFATFSSFSQYSPAIFTRLLIPGALKGATDKVLYLDADIICVGSIAELRALDMSNTIAAAVSDHAETTVKRQVVALNLRHQCYFNSGVLYMHVDNWIANNITEQVMRTIIETDKKLTLPDQDALNIVLDGRAVFIDEKWNFRYNLEAVLNDGGKCMGPDGEGVFLHFTGRVKPWHDWNLHESTSLFVKYQSLSPWAGTPLDPPKNYKEMRMFSRFLFKQGQFCDSVVWYFRYLAKKISRVRKAA
jgi:UDP-glucose:(glucosyl)LPS alpha-1,3-glucosyltransferase